MKRFFKFFISEFGRIIVGILLFAAAILVDYLHRMYSFSVWALVLYILTLAVAGAPVFIDAVRGILRGDLLDEKFLMSVASIGAMIIGEMREGAAVMLFFLVGEYFEHKAVRKSRKSIRALMDIRPDEASVIIDGVERVLDADDVEVGSLIVVRAGERVPIDSVVVSGTADVDNSAITGESALVATDVGSELSAGAVVINGVLTAKTLRPAGESAAARILRLVENANERKARAESFITKFSHYYTPIVVGLAVLFATVPPIFKLMRLGEAVYRALIFLVISCPCALVISVPMAFFGGIGGAAAKGILYKGGNAFSPLAHADTFVFDKTGTLTAGRFEVREVCPVGVSRAELSRLAASAEYGSNHPIAKCIRGLYPDASVPDSIREIAGRGVMAELDGHKIAVGNAALLSECGAMAGQEKYPSGAVLVCRDGDFIGYIVVADAIRSEARAALQKIKKSGAKRLVMLSGDRRENAEAVGRELGFDDIKAELLPENKYEILEDIISSSHGTVYVGDGINDAPAIARADVGVAMGGIGSDSAIEAADVVITSDNLMKLADSVHIARRTVRISTENIIFALGVKLAVLILGALGVAGMWLAVFADVGVAALAILNSMRTLR
ncbi:MAG: cadmium-translocating P-type ATPase [Clostridia bacterium]|nr:cadmium-translocating P-type ATPase [Clostridia bacterium]